MYCEFKGIDITGGQVIVWDHLYDLKEGFGDFSYLDTVLTSCAVEMAHSQTLIEQLN